MIRKPPSCAGCVLQPTSPAFVPPSGPLFSSLYFLSEAAGKTEEFMGEPLVGDAGGVFNRALRLAKRVERAEARVGNVLWCRPPNNELTDAPYEDAALQTCWARHVAPDIEEWLKTPSPNGRKVVVAMGGHALRRVLGLPRGKGVRVHDFHRSVLRDPTDRFDIVTSFHPSFIQRGAWNLLGVLSHDLRLACDVAAGQVGTRPDPVDLVVDPSPEWFGAWVDAYLAELAADPSRVWLSIDIETYDKLSKTDEGELTLLDKDYTILRVNFACSTEQGVTVPFTAPYLSHIRRACASPGVKVLWHARYDVPRLRFREVPVLGPIFDAMWMTHVLQSDLPRGLGFWAPYYSDLPPWKHWHGERFGEYSAMDAVQELRVALGAASELVDRGQWDVFYRHVYLLDTLALMPAEDAGLLVDQPELGVLEGKLDAAEADILAKVQLAVPIDLHPLTGGNKNTGLVREPDPEKEQFPIIRWDGKLPVKCCKACGAVDVAKTHRCEDRALSPDVHVTDATVTRWFRREPFNPDSSKQVLRYIQARHHRPGKNKKTKNPSADKDALERLVKTTRDPFYALVLDRRAVTKVNRTYVKGTKRKLAEDPRSRVDGRLHPTFLHKPSTLRLSCQSPNLQNVVADRGARTALAAGFRRCLVSAPGHVLIEADFAGIEAVLTGWFMGDPDYMRLGRLGVHAYVTAKRVGTPVDLTWDDRTLGRVLHDVKHDPANKKSYDRAKRCVHGCVPGDHEVLTPHGWVRIDKVPAGSQVAQWDQGKVQFVLPSAYTDVACANPNLVQLSGRGIQIQMTHDHRVPVRNVGSAPRVRCADSLLPSDRIPVSGELGDLGAVAVRHGALALAVAIQADASVYGRRAVFHLVRPRKVARLRDLISSIPNINAIDLPCKCHPTGRRIRCTIPPEVDYYLTLPGKDFILPALLRLPAEGRTAFLEEVLYWDGSKHSSRAVAKRHVYFSTNKHNVLVVQTLLHLSGRQGLVRRAAESLRFGTKPVWLVSFNRRRWARVRGTIGAAPAPARVYCVTVPSGFFFVRWRDTISVTGNSNYGLTAIGMHNTYPELFPTIRAAQEELEFYYGIAPKLPKWHAELRDRAHAQGYLGGPGDHPFAYRHWFYNVLTYRPVKGKIPRGATVSKDARGRVWEVKLGEDSKRVVAFYPQSTAAAIIKEAMLRLFDPGHESYVGAAGVEGRTPLRAQIHDSLLLEVPEHLAGWVIARVVREMTRPIPELPLDHVGQPGKHLSIGVEVKQGRNWGEYDDRAEAEVAGETRPNPNYNPRGMREVDVSGMLGADVWTSPVAADRLVPVDLYDEEEAPADLHSYAMEGVVGTEAKGREIQPGQLPA